MNRLKNRRGVTLVLMAFMLTVLIGSAAFAVDFGRMMLYRTELHTASDAAALAGAYQILKKDPASASDSAIALAARHTVDAGSVTLAPSDVIPGRWSVANGFVPTVWTDPDVNAVETTTRYTGIFTFGKLLGLTIHNVTATSQAVMAYVGRTSCVRPVAIPYQSLLNQLYPVDPVTGNPTMDVSHDLTDADVANLQNAGPDKAVSLKLGSDSQQGNFYIVNLGPYSHSDQVPLSPSPNFGGQPVFVNRFGGDCSNSPWSIGPGDWLEGKTGDADGPTQAGFELLCNVSITGNGTVACDPSLSVEDRSIKVAMWATEDDGVCTPRCFKVKYVGVFVITAYTKSAQGDDGISGYFSTLASSGAFTDSPSPIRKIGLVK